jgi:hypothetical protein
MGSIDGARGRLKVGIDGIAWPKKLADELARFVIAKNDAVFADAQAPKPRELAGQSSHIALLPCV